MTSLLVAAFTLLVASGCLVFLHGARRLCADSPWRHLPTEARRTR